MKHTVIAAALAATAASLSGCALFQHEPPALHIDYEARNANATGLIRAFDMKGKTVLQFFDVAQSKPAIYAGDAAAPLPYQVVGQQLAVLPGAYPLLRIEANGATTTITRRDLAAPSAAEATQSVYTQPKPAPTAAGQLGDVAAAQHTLDQAKHDLAAVRETIAKQTDKTPPAEVQATREQLDQIEQRMTDAAKIIMRVSFDFNSADFEPPADKQAQLLADAKAASLINVRGRTDSYVADAPNYRIALARALAARDWLTKRGVDASKIRVFSLPAGAFIADNHTEAGRRQNRRVEIEMLGKEAARLAQLAEARRTQHAAN
jgi:outer membrane protein OmpA-like peptidoglycan-associated protein